MADSPNLPGSHSRPVASDGGWSREWYGYFRELANFVSVSTANSVSLEAITAQLTALEEAVDGLATQEQPTLNAPFSVVIDGSLESGAALFRLDGDVVSPAAYTYYGMGDDAANGKGFWPVPVISVNDAQGVVILNNTETVSTATRDLIQADRDKYLRFTHSGAKTFTVIEEATDPITQDTLVTGRVVGAGDLTIVEDGAVVVNPPAGGSLVIPPDTTFTLLRVAEDVWDLFYAPDPVASVVSVPIGVAASDETTALTTGAAKVTFRMPYAYTLTAVRASVTTAPTGSVLTVDINEGGSTILSTKITIDAGEKTSTTAATPPVISDTSLADDAEITIDIDTVGSTIAGAGLKVWLIGYKTP
jgi:hypothetical protein